MEFDEFGIGLATLDTLAARVDFAVVNDLGASPLEIGGVAEVEVAHLIALFVDVAPAVVFAYWYEPFAAVVGRLVGDGNDDASLLVDKSVAAVFLD